MSLQWEFSVHPCISIKFCCLIAFPPHPLAYYFIEVLLEVQVAMEAARGNPCLPAFNESTSKVTRLEMSLQNLSSVEPPLTVFIKALLLLTKLLRFN